MAQGPDHLAERLAARLGGVGGLGAAPDGAGEPRRAAPPAGDALPMPPPVQAEAPRQAAPTSPPAADMGSTDDDASAVDPAFAGDAAPEHAAERDADLTVGALVLDRPVRRNSRPRDELAPAPGVNLDTMVPAPLTLDLVSLERAGLVVGRKARTRISEEFRVSVGQILRSVRGSYTPGRGAGNLVMVTSARPGEGKSFTALNLAGSIAQHTQREVLLVDVDAKQNALSDQLGIGDRPGLIEIGRAHV